MEVIYKVSADRQPNYRKVEAVKEQILPSGWGPRVRHVRVALILNCAGEARDAQAQVVK